MRLRDLLFGLGLLTNIACSSVRPSLQQPAAPVDGLFAVSGGTMHLHCIGEGSPVVVFDAGFGDDGRVWNQVAPETSRLTRACVFDRLGLGYSSPAPRPHSVPAMVSEERALLARAGLSAPFVFVGHSLGGLNAQLYARRHPDEAAGLVLVDSSSPWQSDRLWSLLPPEQMQAFERHLQAGRDGLDLATFRAGMAEARSGAGPRASLPLAVLSAGKVVPQGGPPELDVQMNDVWLVLQRELVGLTSNSAQVVAPQSGHYSQFEDPALVVSAVGAVVQAARTGHRVELSESPKGGVPPATRE